MDYDNYGLEYPATSVPWKSPLYLHSKNRGRDNLRAVIKGQCNTEEIVLVGFSQGSHVIGDVLSKNVGGLTRSERRQIKAVVLVADPRFNSREPFDAGSFARGRNGLLGARTPGDLGSVARRTRAWCQKRDLVCQGLPNPLRGVHNEGKYLTLYGGGIVAFIRSKLGWSGPPPPPPPPPPAPPITFDEVPLGTYVALQYLDQGVVFGGDDPFTAEDDANLTSPVLSGSPLFFGSIQITLVAPYDETRPRSVGHVELDVGYMNSLEGAAITAYDVAGNVVASTYTENFGIEHVTLDSPGIHSITVSVSADEPAGAAIDNLAGAGVSP